MMCTQDLVFHGAARATGSGHSVGITDAGGSGSGASVGLLPSPLIHPARAAGSGHRVGITDAVALAVAHPQARCLPRRSAPPGRRKDLGAPTPDNRAAAGAAAGAGKEIRSEIEMILKKNNTVTVS